MDDAPEGTNHPAAPNAADPNQTTSAPAVSLAVEEERSVRREELSRLAQTGPRAGNQAGALAFLALIMLIGAALHFYLSDRGGSSYLNRLNSELQGHAELVLASQEEGARTVVSPSWPFRFYEKIRSDIFVYVAFAFAAAWFWTLSARARARRDAFIVHAGLRDEIAHLRRRVEQLERGSGMAAADTPNAADDPK